MNSKQAHGSEPELTPITVGVDPSIDLEDIPAVCDIRRRTRGALEESIDKVIDKCEVVVAALSGDATGARRTMPGY